MSFYMILECDWFNIISVLVTKDGVRIAIWFIDHLQVVTTT
jgi:hypothetical protein